MSRVAGAYVGGAATEVRHRCFVLDLETTGLNASTQRVIEVAVQEYVSGQSVAEMRPCTVLVNPGMHIPARASSIHGLYDGDVRDKPCFDEAWPIIEEYVRSRCGRGERAVIVAHNAKFDIKFIVAECERANLALPTWLACCSLQLARKLWPGRGASLDALRKQANIADGVLRMHRAGADVAALAKVLDHMDARLDALDSSVQATLLKSARSIKEFVSTNARRASAPPGTAPAAPTYDDTAASPVPRVFRRASVPASAPPKDSSATRRRGAPQVEADFLQLLKCKPRIAPTIQDVPETPEATASKCATPVPIDAASSDVPSYLFITETGCCYHFRESCSGLRNARRVIRSEKSSVPRLLRPCRSCTRTEKSGGTQSPRSVRSFTSDNDNNVTAKFFHSKFGTKYHVSRDCFGLRSARATKECETRPTDLDACKICVLRIAYQNE